MTKSHLIFLPAPAPGHLVSSVEFARRLLTLHPHLSITILLIPSPFNLPKNTPTPSSHQGRLTYINIPQAKIPLPEQFTESVENAISAYIASHRSLVRDAIARLQNSVTNPLHVSALLIDMFCTSMIDVANQLHLPSYIFFCSSAAFLGLILHLQARSNESEEAQLSESDGDLTIPCFQNPLPARNLPSFAFSKAGCASFVNHARRFAQTKGIIVNTFAELEPHALSSISYVYQTAPVYPVGPILDLSGQAHRTCDLAEKDRILTWLDKQPESSVVFLCFGSGGYFSKDQTREIAKGLSNSGQRFLWSLRKPPSEGEIKPTEFTETELKGVFPEEFWEILEDERGMICGWAPQVEILGHKSTGAFVSHCGWNSTLESLWFGKPIVTWPLYAEQQSNAFELVRELGLAVELAFDYRVRSSNLLEADKVERAVRSVMEKDNPVRCKVKEMAEVGRGALMEGGSSFRSVEQLIRNMIGEGDRHGGH